MVPVPRLVRDLFAFRIHKEHTSAMGVALLAKKNKQKQRRTAKLYTLRTKKQPAKPDNLHLSCCMSRCQKTKVALLSLIKSISAFSLLLTQQIQFRENYSFVNKPIYPFNTAFIE